MEGARGLVGERFWVGVAGRGGRLSGCGAREPGARSGPVPPGAGGRRLWGGPGRGSPSPADAGLPSFPFPAQLGRARWSGVPLGRGFPRVPCSEWQGHVHGL